MVDRGSASVGASPGVFFGVGWSLSQSRGSHSRSGDRPERVKNQTKKNQAPAVVVVVDRRETITANAVKRRRGTEAEAIAVGKRPSGHAGR